MMPPNRDSIDGPPEATRHRPVLCQAVLDAAAPALAVCTDPLIVDGTVGFGGHSAALAAAAPLGARIVGIDRDPEAVAAATRRLADLGARAQVLQGSYADIEDLVPEAAEGRVALVLVDLGLSSWQLDAPARGFSIRGDGPVDMRFDQTSGLTALERLATMDETSLAQALRRYGDVPNARRVARGILQALADGALTSTGSLARVVERLVRAPRGSHIHSATTVFQALRIVTNDEIWHLESFLARAPRWLRPGGRLLTIAFHSVEDRLVKHTLRVLETGPPTPPRLPVLPFAPVLRAVQRRPITATDAEIEENPRARSARLRVFERTSAPIPEGFFGAAGVR